MHEGESLGGLQVRGKRLGLVHLDSHHGLPERKGTGERNGSCMDGVRLSSEEIYHKYMSIPPSLTPPALPLSLTALLATSLPS